MLFILHVLMVIFSIGRLRYGLWYLLPSMVILRREVSLGQKTERKECCPETFSHLIFISKFPFNHLLRQSEYVYY